MRLYPVALSGLIVGIAWTILPLPVCAHEHNNAQLSVSQVNRSVRQDQGAWVIDYRLRCTGKNGIIITPEDIIIKAEGWVSNSRVVSHAIPRRSSLLVSQATNLTASSEVIPALDALRQCREKLQVCLWAENQSFINPNCRPVNFPRGIAAETMVAGLPKPVTFLPLSLAANCIIRIQLRFEHEHVLYGDYDPSSVHGLSR